MDVKAGKTLTSHSTQGTSQATEINYSALGEKNWLAAEHG